MKSIGEKIKELRLKNDMTQEKLADYLFVTYQTVSKWETGVTSPDLSMIVPLARLFRVTTDELFDFRESVEDLKREELKKRYDDTFKTGDINERLVISGEAVKTYPADMMWLNKYAWDIWCNAFSIVDDTGFNAEREKAIELFRKVIENCDSDEIKGNAITGIVQCLNGKGDHIEAKRYAEMYPDVKVSADEKEKLLMDCMTGKEKTKKQQERIMIKAYNLLEALLLSDLTNEALFAAENIIKTLVSDGNYFTFHYQLYIIYMALARNYINADNHDAAITSILKARNHAISYDAIEGNEFVFTTPLFNLVKYNTEDWFKTGTNTTLESFRELLNSPSYAPLKSHRDYAKLIK